VIGNRGNRKLATEAKSLYDDVMTLTAAIEEAINKGQKSMAGLTDILESGVVYKKDFAVTRGEAKPGVVGWLDDF